MSTRSSAATSDGTSVLVGLVNPGERGAVRASVVRSAGRRLLRVARLAACGQGRLTGPHPAGPEQRTTAVRTTRRLTYTEREQRRDEDRKRLNQAAEQLVSSEGWQRWVRVRARGGFARLSFNNQLLVALACPDATFVAGFKAWLVSGSAYVRAESDPDRRPDPAQGQQDDNRDEDGPRPRVLFKGVSVFDRRSTHKRAPANPDPRDDPCARHRLHLIRP